MKKQTQKGFTLVEIAIVLVIIGLLIGGILRGQELITSARVRNIIDQKTSVQIAMFGFMDRYRMLPGDLTAAQQSIVGNNAVASVAGQGGDGSINLVTGQGFSESALVFQNLAATGFISCGACLTVTGNDTPTVSNTLKNVFGEVIYTGRQQANAAGTWFFDAALPARNILTTGGSIDSQILAETDRKADDGMPGTGQLRFSTNGNGASALPVCTANLLTSSAATGTWANPAWDNCAGAWLL